MEKRFAFAQDLAREAGALARRRFAGREALKIESKGLQDWVSEADREVEAMIRARIAAAFPQDGFLGEESGAAVAAEGEAGPTWVVDPIDGTACFLAGIPTWCVSIALVSQGEIELGVVYDPNAEELFAARRGQGVRLNGAPLPPPTASRFADGLFGLGHSTRVPPEDLLGFMADLLQAGGMFVRNGSGALMLAYVAAGRLVGYFEPHMNAWDTLAGFALVREAGGWTNDYLTGDALQSGNPVAACAPALAGELGGLLKGRI
ncbi:MAG: inositol monophosphatase [Kiloniellales bacterium]|nr:inositol monophosphatase [Kiloniellales bacterium]